MYHVLAFYNFKTVANPQEEVKLHKEFCSKHDIRGRIYISEEGINAQMSASLEASNEYQKWLSDHSIFANTHIKIHTWNEHAFEKLTIKYREQLAALDCKVDMGKTGEHVAPDKWKEMLEDGHLCIDVRNDYEWEVGKFKNAETPACKTFREFQSYTENLQKRIDPVNTPVMMYCTGGIRCELYSAYLKEKGFEKVYQLDGGVINYGLKEGSKHWQGKLFVFDDRMTIPISNEETETISTCHKCETKTDDYYNCANMDCNELFICCKECIKEDKGCCSEGCLKAPRVRPFSHQNPHKPFRKRYVYERKS